MQTQLKARRHGFGSRNNLFMWLCCALTLTGFLGSKLFFLDLLSGTGGRVCCVSLSEKGSWQMGANKGSPSAVCSHEARKRSPPAHLSLCRNTCNPKHVFALPFYILLPRPHSEVSAISALLCIRRRLTKPTIASSITSVPVAPSVLKQKNCAL